MPKVVRREDVIAAFGPVVPLLRTVILDARTNASAEAVAAAHPTLNAIGRDGHIRRVAGTLRWLYVAEGLVAKLPAGPEGFGVISGSTDHSQGRFVFQFPSGVFTVRRQPHQEDEEHVYIQERLTGLLEQVPLAAGLSHDADLVAYLAVPAEGVVQLHVTHTTLTDPMTIALDEFVVQPTGHLPKPAPLPERQVTSKRAPAAASQVGDLAVESASDRTPSA